MERLHRRGRGCAPDHALPLRGSPVSGAVLNAAGHHRRRHHFARRGRRRLVPRAVHGSRLHRPTRLPEPGPAAGRARSLLAHGRQGGRGADVARATPSRCWRSPFASLLFTYLVLRLQDHLPFNPQGLRPGRPGPGHEHRHQLHDQHQLAELHRRDDDVLLLPDGRAGHAQLPVRGDRHRAGGGPGPRHLEPTAEDRRQLLRRRHPRDPLRAAADRRSWRRSSLLSQGAIQTLSSYPVAHTLEGAQQTIAVGPFASQEAIKDLGNNGGGPFNANSAHPFENPNGFTNQFEIFLELLIPFGAGADVRPHGRQREAGPGHRRDDGHHPGRRHRHRGVGRAVGQSRAHGDRRQPGQHVDAGRRQHGGQVGSLRADLFGRSSRPPPPAPAPAPSTPATTASRRSAAWCRWS